MAEDNFRTRLSTLVQMAYGAGMDIRLEPGLVKLEFSRYNDITERRFSLERVISYDEIEQIDVEFRTWAAQYIKSMRDEVREFSRRK